MQVIEGGKTPVSDSKPRRSYICTVCGKIGFWDKDWSYYGSLALAEVCPKDLPYSCSKPCQKVAEENIKLGKWELPKLRMTPGGGVVVREKRGY